MKKLTSLLLVVLMLLCMLTACDPDAEEIDWINIKLGHVLPQPQSNLMEIVSNDDENLLVYVHEISQNQFLEYQRWCEEEKGFNIEIEMMGNSFDAYNQEGYHLLLSYSDGQDEMHITLETPIPMENFELPEYAVAAGLPIPASSTGHYNWQNEDSFSLYVGETTREDYFLYKDACVEAGFTEDPYEYNTVYSATNAAGHKVSLNYKGFNIFMLEFSSTKGSGEEITDKDSSNNADQQTEPVEDTELSIAKGTEGEVAVPAASYEFKYDNYEDVQKKLEDAGFTNITTSILYDIFWGLTEEGEVDSVSIDGKINFEEGEVFSKDAPIVITYHMREEDNPNKAEESNPNTSGTEEARAVFYSTNDYETAKKGNTGVFSYKNKSGSYDIYWIIDFDEGYVYYFTDGNGETFCDRVKIVSGDLNDRITATWHDGGDQWSWYLHFKYVNHPETLVINDHNGFATEFTTTDLDDALALRATKNIKDY